MSKRISAIWASRPEAYGPRRHRRACQYEAYVPDPLAELRPLLSGELAADVADVERALARFDVQVQAQHDLETLARFLLRAEAVASSKIEGLVVSTRRLARHEALRSQTTSRAGARDATAEAVLGNVEAMRLAVDAVAAAPRVVVGDVQRIHASLMEMAGQPQLAGVVRTEQNWIGGNNFNPCDAAFVPPPPDELPALLEDLAEAINRDDLPAVVQAGLVHAQFETLHPFADGNGRTGRALVHVVLRRRGLTTSFIPPISLVLATDAARYITGLTRYRYEGPPDSAAATESLAAWLDVFVTAAARAVHDAETLTLRMQDLEARWRAAVRPRRGSAADLLLPRLVAHPTVSVNDVAVLVDVSRPAAAAAVDQLVESEVLMPSGASGRRRLYEARAVFDVLTDYERALGTSSGDTRIERPSRPVPARREPPPRL